MRQAIHAGVFGSLGVVVAWLLWVAMQAFARNPVQVFVAPVIGATVGVALEFLRSHLVVAAREAREGPSAPPEVSAEQLRRLRERPAYGARGGTFAVAATFAGLFLFAVCQNLVGDMMLRLVAPFLVTLALFFPIGAWLGWVFRERLGLGSVASYLARGVLAGLGAAAIAWLVAAFLGLGAFDTESLLGFLGWWLLIGIGWGLAHTDCDEARPWAPIAGTVLAATLVSVALGTASGGALGLLRPVTDRLAVYALAQPGLPEKYWDRAVEEFAARNQDTSTGQATDGGRPAVPNALAPSAVLRMPLDPRSGSVGALMLARELELGTSSALVRSWLVLLLFSTAVGLGRGLEWRLRPLAYGRSETRINDLKLAAGAVIVWLCAIGYVGILGW